MILARRTYDGLAGQGLGGTGQGHGLAAHTSLLHCPLFLYFWSKNIWPHKTPPPQT